MLVGWEWDETLFARTAAHYVCGRPSYAPVWPNGGRGACWTADRFEVGCGPGTVTVPLASFFAEAVGLDLDAGKPQVAAL